jgi:hypothetical protein
MPKRACGLPWGLRRVDSSTNYWYEGKNMKAFRQKYLAVKGAHAPQQAAPPPADKPSPPPERKFSRKQRRANATSSRLLNKKIQRASALGLPISLRQGVNGLEVVTGKPKKKDPGPQPGEVIQEVDGNVMPEFPQPATEHVHDASCGYGEDHNIFEKADELVESVVGRDGP